MTDSPQSRPSGQDLLGLRSEQDPNTLALTSIALAIVSFCGFFLFYIGLPFAIGAVVCGFIARKRSDTRGGEGRALSSVAIAVGGLVSLASTAGIIMLFIG